MTDTSVHFHWKHAQCFIHWAPGKLDMAADQADAITKPAGLDTNYF